MAPLVSGSGYWNPHPPSPTTAVRAKRSTSSPSTCATSTVLAEGTRGKRRWCSIATCFERTFCIGTCPRRQGRAAAGDLAVRSAAGGDGRRLLVDGLDLDVAQRSA